LSCSFGQARALDGGRDVPIDESEGLTVLGPRASAPPGRLQVGFRVQAHVPVLRDLTARIFGLGVWPPSGLLSPLHPGSHLSGVIQQNLSVPLGSGAPLVPDEKRHSVKVQVSCLVASELP
jgi:hypothetical protein